MSCLGNIIWFLCGGFWQGMGWLFSGIIWCITIIGLPIGKQCFKFASLAFVPFDKEIVYGGGAISTLAIIFWLVFSGIPLAISAALNGIFFVLYDYWYTVWKTMFQNNKIGSFTFRCYYQRKMKGC